MTTIKCCMSVYLHILLLHFLIISSLVMKVLSELTCEHAFMLRERVDHILATLSDHIEVLSRVKYLLFVLRDEDWNHLFSVSELFLPVLIIEVLSDVFLA